LRFWQLWVLLIFVGSGPWFGVLSTPQWDHVTWVPFTSPTDKASDMIINTLMLLPLGWTFKTNRRGFAGTATVLLMALAVSIGAESMQLYCARRDPSATDVTMNAVGTLLGAAGASLWRRRPLP
jgi:glycopeptide antibiotics resistance protein